MNRADAVALDELKLSKGSRINPDVKSFDLLIVEKSKFLYTVCDEGQLTKEETTIAKEKLLELIKSF